MKGMIYYVAMATVIFSHMKLSYFCMKALLVFHWCLQNKIIHYIFFYHCFGWTLKTLYCLLSQTLINTKTYCQDQDLSTGNGSCIYGVPDMCIILKRRRVRRITKLTKKKGVEDLIIFSPWHGSESIFSHSKDMRVHITHGLATVGGNNIWAIQRQLLIRVDSNQHNTYTTKPQIQSGLAG